MTRPKEATKPQPQMQETPERSGPLSLNPDIVLALVVIILLISALFPQGTNTTGFFVVGSLLVLLSIATLLGEPGPLVGGPLAWQIGLYVLGCFIACFYSPYWMRSWTKFSWTLCGLALFFVVARNFRDRHKIRTLIWVAAAAGILVAIYSLWNEMTIDRAELARHIMESPAFAQGMKEDLIYSLSTARLSGTFGNSNHLAGFLVAVSGILLLEVLRGDRWKSRLLSVLGLLPILVAIYLSRSRSGLLTLILAVIIVLLGSFSQLRKNIFHWRLSPLKVAVILVVVLLAAFLFAEASLLARVETIKTRLIYYSVATKLIAQAPLVGHGLDSYALLFPPYHQLGQGEAQYVHNWPLEVWVEMGVIGLGIFLWFVFSIYLVFNHALNDAQDRREESLLLALMSGVSAILLQSLFDFNHDVWAVFLYFCFFLGCLSALASSPQTQHRQPMKKTARNRAKALRFVACFLLLVFWAVGIALPYNARRNFDLGVGLLSAEDSDLQAFSYLQRAVKYAPNNAEYRNALGLHLVNLGQPQRGLKHLKLSVYLNPMKARNHFDLYKALLVLDEPKAARAQLVEAHELHPEEPEYLFHLARWHGERGEREKAREYWGLAEQILKDAIEANPNKAEYEALLAQVYEALGKQNQAAIRRRKAREKMQEVYRRLGMEG